MLSHHQRGVRNGLAQFPREAMDLLAWHLEDGCEVAMNGAAVDHHGHPDPMLIALGYYEMGLQGVPIIPDYLLNDLLADAGLEEIGFNPKYAGQSFAFHLANISREQLLEVVHDIITSPRELLA